MVGPGGSDRWCGLPCYNDVTWVAWWLKSVGKIRTWNIGWGDVFKERCHLIKSVSFWGGTLSAWPNNIAMAWDKIANALEILKSCTGLDPGNHTLWRGVLVVPIRKSFGSSERDWKPRKKSPIPCKFCTYRFIRYSLNCYAKVRIDPLMKSWLFCLPGGECRLVCCGSAIITE